MRIASLASTGTTGYEAWFTLQYPDQACQPIRRDQDPSLEATWTGRRDVLRSLVHLQRVAANWRRDVTLQDMQRFVQIGRRVSGLDASLVSA
jgi:hypothetical protein